MAAYALAAGAGMEALKCMKAGCCCVESDSKFNLAEAYGLRRVSQAEYRRNPLYEINKSIGPDLLAQASRTLAQILLKELGEENK